MVKETRTLDNNHSAVVTGQGPFPSRNQKIDIVEKVVFYKTFSKFKIGYRLEKFVISGKLPTQYNPI